MPIEVNRFSELVEAIRKTVDRFRAQRLAQETSRRQGEIALQWLVEFSPEAIPGRTLMTTGHDHTRIVDGWRGPYERIISEGAESVILNTSEHIDVQRSGTASKGYLIEPRRREVARAGLTGMATQMPAKLFFWLGSPLIWPVRAARFRKPGFVWMTEVRHPGFGPHGGRDFVESAADRARPEMVQEFSQMGYEVAFKPLKELLG